MRQQVGSQNWRLPCRVIPRGFPDVAPLQHREIQHHALGLSIGRLRLPFERQIRVNPPFRALPGALPEALWHPPKPYLLLLRVAVLSLRSPSEANARDFCRSVDTRQSLAACYGTIWGTVFGSIE